SVSCHFTELQMRCAVSTALSMSFCPFAPAPSVLPESSTAVINATTFCRSSPMSMVSPPEVRPAETRGLYCAAMKKLALLAFFLASLFATAQTPQYDILIRNGKVVDGSGNPWFYADIGIVGDRIAFIGHADPAVTAKR